MTPVHPLQARSQYVQFVRRNYPQVFANAVNYANRNERPGPLGDAASTTSNGATTPVASTSWWSNFLDSALKTGTAILTLQQQKDILKVQTERARMGLPPLETGDYYPGMNLGLTSSTRDDFTKWILIGGGVILAALVIKKMA